MGFGFANVVPVYLDSVSIFLPCQFSLLAPRLCFLFAFEFNQELLVHPCRPLANLAQLPACVDGLSVSLEDVVLEKEPTLLDTFSHQAYLSWILPSRSQNRHNICFLEVWG